MIGPTHICGVIDDNFEWMAKVRHRDSLENPPGGAVLGSRFNIFSMPNDLGLSRGAIVYAEAGRAAGARAVRDSLELFIFLIFGPEPFGARRRSRPAAGKSPAYWTHCDVRMISI